ncbi:hypothetical protein CEY16_05235 [Halalkalibacillus sediminis]|uniref:Uncharacterized protein n=1 Tax=Halalkalibacillus sediminis TaxID=2018042 RepID=A0A2I0QXU9_9BACI|nr:hypothetical protein CEY16_05235 [Halalkalibacillus sediminis]
MDSLLIISAFALVSVLLKLLQIKFRTHRDYNMIIFFILMIIGACAMIFSIGFQGLLFKDWLDIIDLVDMSSVIFFGSVVSLMVSFLWKELS